MFETVDASVVAAAVLVECGVPVETDGRKFRAATADQFNNIQWGAFGHELWSGTVLQSDGVSKGWLSDGTATDVTTGLAETCGWRHSVVFAVRCGCFGAVRPSECSAGGQLVLHVPIQAINLLLADKPYCCR